MEGKIQSFAVALSEVEYFSPAGSEGPAMHGLRLGNLALKHRRTQDAEDRACEKLRGLARDILEKYRQNPGDSTAAPDVISRVYCISAPLDAANFVRMQGLPLFRFVSWLEVATVNLMSWNDLQMQVLSARTAEVGQTNDRFLEHFALIDEQIRNDSLAGTLFERPSFKVKGLYGPDRAKFVGAAARVSLLAPLLEKKGEFYNAFKEQRNRLFGVVPISAGESQVSYALRIANVCREQRWKNPAISSAYVAMTEAGTGFLSYVLSSIPLFRHLREDQWLSMGGYSEMCNVYIHTAALVAVTEAPTATKPFVTWLDVAAPLFAAGDVLSIGFLRELAAARRIAATPDDDPFPTKDGNDLILGIKDSPCVEGLERECATLKALFDGIGIIPC